MNGVSLTVRAGEFIAVVGISWGKVKAEEVRFVRANGTAASGIVENGSTQQYEELKKFGYMDQAMLSQKTLK